MSNVDLYLESKKKTNLFIIYIRFILTVHIITVKCIIYIFKIILGPVQMMPGGPGQPAPHVNPAFFQQPSGAPQGPPGHPGYGPPNGPSSRPYMSNEMGMSEQELEEIMSRNRTVSSSAIARAVADAAAGDFSNAIETLVTAISLIKQSKVASDERCKILVSSLHDTLHGIETKSYSSRRGNL